MKLAGKLISKNLSACNLSFNYISCNFLLLFDAFYVFRKAFGTFQIRANAFEFLAAVITHIFV